MFRIFGRKEVDDYFLLPTLPPSNNTNDDPNKSSWLIPTHGKSWNIPQWHQPYPGGTRTVTTGGNFSCVWTTFVATSGKSVPMCVHPFPDFISGVIAKEHRWPDCDLLPVLWRENQPNQVIRWFSITFWRQRQPPLFVDIGANIGSCVLEMLLSTEDSHILAVEPHPMNRFALEMTLRGLPTPLQDRVTLVPIGLGKENHQVLEIFTGETNMGNSVLGKAIRDVPDQQIRSDRYPISVERLDSILLPPATTRTIPLVKLDAQGYECNVLEGMGVDLGRKIQTIKFEVATHHLQEQNCLDLFARLRSLGFHIRPVHNGKDDGRNQDNSQHKTKEKPKDNTIVQYIDTGEVFDVATDLVVSDYLAVRSARNTKAYTTTPS
ncbi:expressed unknown protein [Seminavis robusta]|uniref:Methyltransferase FkbM domain-containing protein n=1 Tax=Seminavis robusta TaxID=568900 RepID=A0A9N8H714_9STRA|nr:expressed unknown protein [Seminavis robusta]|eukprot:Sro116_g056930.1 n/a (378) ;mRNA; r:9149-10282